MADPERAEDLEDMEEEEEGGGGDLDERSLKGILKNPEVLAALHSQGRCPMVDIMQFLPPSVKRRVKALKRLQLETTKIEAEFYDEVHRLECKYHQRYTQYFEKRRQVIAGDYEPTDVESEWPSDDEKEDELSADMKKKVKIVEEEAAKEEKKEDEKKISDDAKGIPDFWLTIFKNVDMLADMVQEHDEPLIKHLTDIKIQFLEKDPMGFILEFHFSPNDYFSNTVLTKEYEMKCVPDESDPFSFEGPEIFQCKGCKIDWKKGKNITVKTIRKKQKHKSRGSVRTVTKTVQNDSFFNFFSPPNVPDDPEADIDEETRALLTTDFEIGHYIRERIVPRAVLFFTGEALEDDEYEEEEGEEGEEEEDEEGGLAPTINTAPDKQNAECKQQ